jgi:chitin synthase
LTLVVEDSLGELKSITAPQKPTRKKSLTRPDRNPLSRQPSGRSIRDPLRFREQLAATEEIAPIEEKRKFSCWRFTIMLFTWYIPDFLLRTCGGMKDKTVRFAWREKVTLCKISFLLCALLGFITFALQNLACDSKQIVESVDNGFTKIHEYVLKTDNFPYDTNIFKSDLINGKDITPKFPRFYRDVFETGPPIVCKIEGSDDTTCFELELNKFPPYKIYKYEWSMVNNRIDNPNLVVLNGYVIDVGLYFNYKAAKRTNDEIWGSELETIFTRINSKDEKVPRDISKLVARALSRDKNAVKVQRAITGIMSVGLIDGRGIGCVSVETFSYLSFGVIIAVIMIRFFLAMYFSWFIQRRMVHEDPNRLKKGPYAEYNTLQTDSSVMLPSKGTSFSDRGSTGNFLSQSRYSNQLRRSSSNIMYNFSNMRVKKDSTNSETMYSILLVTCYSEGEEGLRNTLDSLANSDYPDDQKLIFVICDGLITGSGNAKPTPDIVLDLITLDDELNFNVEPKSYLAIADGMKRHNMARVYAGHCVTTNHRVPAIVVVKCGTPQEFAMPKPGNRGKRDSQIILMSFLSKVLFDDRLLPLEYEMFDKIVRLTGM